jgi:sugar phosphate isomerase/epimerase
MQVGIFAKTFAAGGALPALEASRRAGYDVVQFNMALLGGHSMPEAITQAQCEEIAAASRQSGVAIAAVSGTYNMIHPDAGVRADGLARLGVLIRAAPLMGTRLVTLCTGTRHPTDQWGHHPDNAGIDAWHDLLVEMAKAVSLAEESGVDLGIEPELANVVSSAELARQLIDSLGSPRIKIVLDPANLFETASTDEARTIVAQAVDMLADRVVMAHAKDRRADGGFAAAGSGIIDFGHFVRSLRHTGFDGPLVTHGLTETEAPAVAAFLRRVLTEAIAA